MRLRAILITILVFAACAALSRVRVPPPSLSVERANDITSAMVYTAARQYDADAWINGGERFPQGAVIMLTSGKPSKPLVPGFAATADPDISFDGSTVIFAGKKAASDPWQIWQLVIGDDEPRRVVSAADDLVRPMYLPENIIVYARRQNGRFVLETAPLAGGKPSVIFHAPGSALPTDVLHDGRILFEAMYPLDAPSKLRLGGGVPEVYTVYPDGSGVESYRCDHGQPRHSGAQVSSGDIIFIKGHRLARFTSPLAHDVDITSPAGEYAGDVIEISSHDWILPWRSNAKKQFELKRWTPGSKTLVTIAAEPGLNLLQPALVSTRPVPNRFPSALHEWGYANLLALDAYISKRVTHPSLSGERANDIPEGSIAHVRVYTRDDQGNPKALGTAPVEHDGSFYVRVPGNQPIKFELLDRTGKTLKKESGWIWAASGEQRICVGCHAGPERAPDNAGPAVLNRSIVPADLTGSAGTSSTGGH